MGARRLLLATLIVMVITACESNNTPPSGSTGARTQPPAASVTPASGSATPRATAGPATARQPAPFDPSSFTLGLEEVAGGFRQPTFVTHAGDGSGRLFVLEQAGLIRILSGGSALPEPFLDIRSLVRSGGEQGLLGLAFHPRYTENGRFFVYYTATNSDNTVAEYRVSGDPNRADPATARVLYAVPDFAPNHNGGMLAFGPDGYLYVGHGDGGGGGDPQRTAQNFQSLLGKILRIDVDGAGPYAIPPDNPFAGRADARGEIWAYGLRNPWRFSFDRATGDLWIADVGQNQLEEIDFQPAGGRGGQNYGWSIMEGNQCFRPTTGCDQSSLVQPVAVYGRDQGISVTGGYVYRGAAYPVMAGGYFYADYGSGRIWSLYRDGSGAWRPTEMLKQDARASSFGEDEAGELYLVGLDTGAIYRLTATPR